VGRPGGSVTPAQYYPALLKFFFRGNPSAIAAVQIEARQCQPETYENLASKVGEGHYGGRGAVLKYRLAFERVALDFWTRLAGQASAGEPAASAPP